MKDDIDLLYLKYVIFRSTPPESWGNELVRWMWNAFFNWVDIMYEGIILEQIYKEQAWTLVGEYTAKIVSDVVFKSPLVKTWNFKNSDVLSGDWGEPMPLWTGIITNFNEFLLYFDEAPLSKEITGVEPPKNSTLKNFKKDEKKPKVGSSRVTVEDRLTMFTQLTECTKTLKHQGEQRQEFKTQANQVVNLYNSNPRSKQIDDQLSEILQRFC